MSSTNYAVAPGEYLAEWMHDHEFSHQRVATLLGTTSVTVDDIITGRTPITDSLARNLKHLTGIPARTWLNYEALYQADKARLDQ